MTASAIALDLDAVGVRSEPWTRSWTSSDTLLYALALGAGPEHLELTTENSEGVTQRAVPTYAALLAGGSKPLRAALGTWPAGAMVHGGQEITWHRELPPEGTAQLQATVAGIHDKGSGALIEIATAATVGGDPLFSTTTSLFLRGGGGFDPDRTRSGAGSGVDPRTVAEPRAVSDEAGAEQTVRVPTSESQALLYRLCGDRNPLHSDPALARRAGFDRPILHGLCTFGITARVLMGQVPGELRSIAGRFRSPVVPGDTLEVRFRPAGPGRLTFRTAVAGAGRPALDDGILTYDPARPDLATPGRTTQA